MTTLVINDSNARCEGDWLVVDQVNHDGHVRCDGSLKVIGYISARGSISARGNIFAWDSISAQGDISARGIFAQGAMVCRGYLIWSHLTPPTIPELILCRGIVPAEWQREYWCDRLGVSLAGCYDKIVADLTPLLPQFLARTDLSPIERMILESHLPERKAAAALRADELEAEHEAKKQGANHAV